MNERVGKPPLERVPENPILSIWMAEYQCGSVEAFDRLHDALAPDLRAYLLGLTRDPSRADDLVQDSFLQMHRARAAHTPGQPVRPWVFAIARRVFLMDQRRSASRVRRESNAADTQGEPAVSLQETERLHALRQVEAGLRKVPSDGRRAFVLHHLFGFSFKEVGARLGITAGTAKVRSSRAASLLRSLLRERNDE